MDREMQRQYLREVMGLSEEEIAALDKRYDDEQKFLSKHDKDVAEARKYNSAEESGSIFRKYQKALSKLTIKQIQDLSDKDIKDLASERPGHPGEFGFMIVQEDFESEDQMAAIGTALMERLEKANNS